MGHNEIYFNKIRNTFLYGTTGFGYDNYLFSTGRNLRFSCNEYADNGLIGDIAITGKLTDQGNAFTAAANTFGVVNAYNGLYNGWMTTNNNGGNVTPSFKYFHPVNNNMIPDYTNGINLEQTINPNIIDYSEQCQPLPLKQILMKTKENSTEVVNTQEYYTVLGDLNNSSNPDLWEKDRILTELINAHLIKGEYANIETLLQGETGNQWRRLQLAEFQRMQNKFVEAKHNLNALITDNDVTDEVKNVAEIYLIRTQLEENGKTWLDIVPSDLNIIRDFAIEQGELPATLVARNVLELVKGMYFDVRMDDFGVSINTPLDSNNIEEPRFSLYPNPIEGQLNLEYSEVVPEQFTVKIYELIENSEVYVGTMESYLFQLDVSEWQTGFYAILVFDTENNELFRSSTHIKN